MTDPRLARIVRLSALLRDRRLAELASTTDELAKRDASLAALSVPQAPSDDLAQAMAAARYDRWIATRRAQLLAQRAALASARDAAAARARIALARADVLARLGRKDG